MIDIKRQINEISCVFGGFDGKGAIYIAGINSAKDTSLLKRLNIKAVLCAAKSGYLKYQKQVVQDYLYIPADDYEKFNLQQYFQRASEFIQKNRKKTNILVHCMAGISRSASLVIAYLIKKYQYTLSSVLSLLQRKRPIISPNPGFLDQLKKYQKEISLPMNKFQNKKQRNIIQNQFQRTSVFSINKNIQNNVSIQLNSNKKRKQLSKQSKQFLNTLKNQKNISKCLSRKTRAISNFQPIIDKYYQTKQNKIETKQFTKTPPNKIGHKQIKQFNDFRSKNLSIEQSIQSCQKRKQEQIKQIKQKLIQQNEQKQKDLPQTSDSIPTSEQIISQSKKRLTQKISQFKINILQEYKKKNAKELINEQKNRNNVQNQEENQINIQIATQILKGTKQRRYFQKKLIQ